jgi:hypothetical protein
MPRDQSPEFNRLIDLMGACNLQVGIIITLVEREVEKLVILSGWWYSLLLWTLNLAEIDFLASCVAREAVTESEHTDLLTQASGAYVSVQNLAFELADYRRAWLRNDLEDMNGSGSQVVVKRESMKRLTDEAEVELREALAAGELESKGSSSKLIISASFDAWLGRPPGFTRSGPMRTKSSRTTGPPRQNLTALPSATCRT